MFGEARRGYRDSDEGQPRVTAPHRAAKCGAVKAYPPAHPRGNLDRPWALKFLDIGDISSLNDAQMGGKVGTLRQAL